MSAKRYSDEFKEEAFVSSSSRATPPGRQQASDRIEAQQEIRLLNRELARTREERDILGQATAHFIKDPDGGSPSSAATVASIASPPLVVSSAKL